MILKQVTVSGTVGKQIAAIIGAPTLLKGFAITPSGANATIKIRDGKLGASGEVIFFGRAPSAQGTKEFQFNKGVKFTRGLHVTVIGANAEAYLYIE